MKKRFFGLFVIATLCNSCTESIGSLDFDPVKTTDFSVFLPGTGTLEFQQESKRTTKASSILTRLRISDDEADMSNVPLEVWLFKDQVFAFDNLDFEKRMVLARNQETYDTINSEGTVLLADNNYHISIFSEDETAIAGHYDGYATVKTTNDDGTETVEELFSVFGTIDKNGQVLLLSTEANASITNIRGTFRAPSLFFGTANSRTTSLGDLTFDATALTDDAAMDDDDMADDEMDEEAETNDLTLYLSGTLDSVAKKLTLNLQKSEL